MRPFAEDQHLFLDEVTRRSLELTRTLRDGGRYGTLLASVDRAVTSMGARMIGEWLLAPLVDAAAINARLDAVGELLREHALREDLRGGLSSAADLQRLTARVSTGRATPRDLAAVARTLALLPRIKARIAARESRLLRELEERLDLSADLREDIERTLVDEPPLSAREGGIIRPGHDGELDELRDISRDGKAWIARFQADEITRTGINSLKVGFNQVFGYYIEVTNTHANRIPVDYQRKQTLKNAERYVTAELKEYEEKVLTAEEKIIQRELDLFVALRDRVAAQTERLLRAAEVLATLDTLAGLAELASERGFCRPTLSQEPILRIRDGRHPVLDQSMLAGTFV
ncbi:MAG: DNA mismatch repair protein MutS, partial [Candidatus Acidiferrum sp.]